MGYRKLNRNTKPATEARIRNAKAGEFAARIYAKIKDMHEQGKSLTAMADYLASEGVKTSGGKYNWSSEQVRRVINRVTQQAKSRQLWS